MIGVLCMISVQCYLFIHAIIILANTEANERRIRNVESCFGASGQVSFELVYSPLSKRVENWGARLWDGLGGGGGGTSLKATARTSPKQTHD